MDLIVSRDGGLWRARFGGQVWRCAAAVALALADLLSFLGAAAPDSRLCVAGDSNRS